MGAAAACSSCQPGGGSSTRGCVPGGSWEGGFGGWVSQERHGHWTNGECFTVGEQGPCRWGELLDRTGGCVQKCLGDKIPFEGSCHQLASTGPCQPGHWLLLVEVKDGQVVAECQERMFENIPVNDETAFSRATLLNCYVDEANNCRRIFTLGPQPARDGTRKGFQISWED